MRVGGVSTEVHSVGQLNRHGQNVKMVLAEAFPPYPQGILPEPQRLNKRAAQPLGQRGASG
ncbi:MAG: hypothetical protein ABSA02_06255 [Trebonia sp.]|jgi:hypothetical protein